MNYHPKRHNYRFVVEHAYVFLGEGGRFVTVSTLTCVTN